MRLHFPLHNSAEKNSKAIDIPYFVLFAFKIIALWGSEPS